MIVFGLRVLFLLGLTGLGVYKNLKVRHWTVVAGWTLLLLGGVSNLLVMYLNGLQMPVVQPYGAMDDYHKIATLGCRLMLLADIWGPSWARFSLGDVLMLLGLVLNLIYGGFRLKPTGK